MASPKNPHIPDELLSAYIDNAVTEDERQQVERAVAADPNVAWRLESLRHTVQLLHQLPELAPPRSFALTVEAIPVPTATRRLQGASAAMPSGAGTLGGVWRRLFQGGNLFLRNAAAGAALLFLLLVGVDFAIPNLQRIELSPTITVSSDANTSDSVDSVVAIVQATPEMPLAQPENALASEAAPSNAALDESVTQIGDESMAARPASSEPAISDAASDNVAAEEAFGQPEPAQVPAAKQIGSEADSGPANVAVAAEPVTTSLSNRTAIPEVSASGASASEMVTASSLSAMVEAAPSDIAVEPVADTAEYSVPETIAAQPATAAMVVAAPSPSDESAAAAAREDAESATRPNATPNAAVETDEDAPIEENAEISLAMTSTDPLTAPVNAEPDVERIARAAPAPESAKQSAPPGVGASQPGNAAEPVPVAGAVKAEPATDISDQEAGQTNAIAVNRINGAVLLWIAQLAAAACTLGFALLWWRSRCTN